MRKYFAAALLLIIHIIISGSVYAECISGNCVDGMGTWSYPSGSRYVGDFKNGRENGKGILYFYNGSRYEGEFKNGNFHGQGNWTYSNGIEYKGSFDNGKLSSEGEFKSPEKIEDSVKIDSILPANVQALLKAPSIRTVFSNFSIRQKSIFGQTLGDMEKVIKKLGMNPLSIWDLKNIGIDTEKETGVAVSNITIDKNKDPKMNLFFFIPVTDSSRFINTVKSFLMKSAKNVKATEGENFTSFEKKGSKVKIYIFKKNNYVFIGGNPSGDADEGVRSFINSENSIKKSEEYRNISSRLKSRNRLFCFINIKEIIKSNYDIIKSIFSNTSDLKMYSMNKTIDAVKEYLSAGFTMDLNSRHFGINLLYRLKQGSKNLDLFKGAKINKGPVFSINKNPLLYLFFRINFNKYYKYITSLWSEDMVAGMKVSFSKFMEQYKIDVEKEIINNLAGDFNLAVYDGKTMSMFNINSLLTFTIKNKKIMEGVINKLSLKLPPGMFKKTKIGNIDTFVISMGMFKVFAGIRNKTLIIAPGRHIYQSAIDGNMKSGFISNMKDKKLRGKFINGTTLFYLNVDETINAVKNFGLGSKFLSPDKLEILKKFNYLLFSSRIRKNMIYGNFSVRTRFQNNFFVEVKNMIPKDKKTAKKSMK